MEEKITKLKIQKLFKMSIIGHKKIIGSLERMMLCKNTPLARSYLFCGPEAVGKFLIAKNFADKLTGWKKGSFNPNLLIIEPEIEEKDGIFKEKEIKIEAIKKLQKDFSLTSFAPPSSQDYSGLRRDKKNYRVAIIRSAQKLNISAQNALLKILEEPPKNTMIILVAEDEKKLLPTIISRCQIKRFGLLSPEEIGGMLDPFSSNREDIIFWSLGRPGWAQKFLHSKKELEEKKEIIKEFQSLLSMPLNEKLFLAEQLSKNTPQLLAKIDLWIILLRNAVLGLKSFVSMPPVRALKLIEEIEKTKKIINSTNSNVRLAIESLFLEF